MPTLCFTGHRPSGLGGYSETSDTNSWVRYALLGAITRAYRKGIYNFYSGGALGVDTWAAEIVLGLKRRDGRVRLTIVKPFPSQHVRWPVDSQARYNRILENADDVVDVSPDPYAGWKMFKRDKFMVDKSDYVVAVYNCTGKGGTHGAFTYAQELMKPIFHIYPNERTCMWVK